MSDEIALVNDNWAQCKTDLINFEAGRYNHCIMKTLLDVQLWVHCKLHQLY